MAKRRQNKAALIREELAKSPTATAAEIVTALSARRVKVTPQHVYNVKATSGKTRKRRGHGGNGDMVAVLLKAKKMAASMGGVDKAREALDALATLLTK